MMRPAISHHSAKSQRGAVVIMTAGFMLLGVLFLALVVDTGRLYMEKRSLQRIADVVALELASTEWCANGAAGGDATVALNRNIPAGAGIAFKSGWPKCGTTSGVPRVFTPSVLPEDGNAVQVEVIHSVSKSLVAGGYFSSDPNVDLWAVAVAARGGIPLAQLTIRSTLATVNGGLLNAIVGGMLGGNVNLSLLSWNGLLNTDISLLTFIDALAVRAGIAVGDYDQVLSTSVTVGNFLSAAIDALPVGTDPDVLIGLNELVNVAVGLPTIKLGDLISVDSNSPSSALDVPLNLLQLVQGSVQLANGDSVVAANLPTVGIPGVASASVKVKVMEPAQISAIGDPSEINLISKEPDEAPNIFVRTAQVRTLVTVNLSGVTGLLNNLTGALSPLLSPIISFIETTSVNPIGGLLNGVGTLLGDLVSLVGGLLTGLLGTSYSTNWEERNIIYAEALAQPISISLDAASASAWVVDHNCAAGGKSLDVKADTSVAYLRIGKMQESDVFSSGAVPSVEPVPVVDIGYRKVRARRTCSRPHILSSWSCSNQVRWETNSGFPGADNQITDENVKRYTIAGLGLKVDGPIGGSAAPTLTYLDPPDIGEEPDFKDVPSSAVLAGLGTTVANGLQPYQSTAQGVLGSLLGGTLSLLSGVVSTVTNLLEGVIAGLLDPILGSLLSTLGADLAVTDLGANLTCNSDEGVRLLN